jgi:hypothetical protein
MLITGEEDLEYVKQTESARMSWCLADVVEMNGDVGLSGGYGLWGPANGGGVIYPDLQPTVDCIINEDGTMMDPSSIDPSILRGAMTSDGFSGGMQGGGFPGGRIPYPGPTPYLEAEMGMPPAIGRTLPPEIGAELPARPQYYPRPGYPSAPGYAPQGNYVPQDDYTSPIGSTTPVYSDSYPTPSTSPMIDEQAPVQSVPFQPAPPAPMPQPVPLEMLPGELPQARTTSPPSGNKAETATSQVSWNKPSGNASKETSAKSSKSRPIRIGTR